MASVVIHPLWLLVLVIYLFLLSVIPQVTDLHLLKDSAFECVCHVLLFSVSLIFVAFIVAFLLLALGLFCPFSLQCGSSDAILISLLALLYVDLTHFQTGRVWWAAGECLWHRRWRSCQMEMGEKTVLLWRLHSCESWWWYLQAATVPQSPHVASTIHPHDLKHILSHPRPDCLLSSTLADWLGVSTRLAVWDVPPYLWKGSYNLYTVYHFKWTALHFWHTAVYSHKRGIENISIYPPNHPYVPLQSTPSLIPRQPLIFCPHSFAFSGMSCKWNHRVCSLLCLYVAFHLA